jgi:hypothetical protein
VSTKPRTFQSDIAVAVAGLIGAVLYSDWLVLEPAIGRDLSPVRSYVSEMGALTHPHHGLVNVLDIISGLCIFFLSLRLVHRLSDVAAREDIGFGCAGLTVFGLATALGALVPMTCMPSVQPTCTAGGLALHGPVQDMVYTALSVLANVGVEASMLLLGLGLVSTTSWAVTARTGQWIFVASAPLGILDALFGLLYPSIVGLPQRALLILQSGWVVAIALRLMSDARAPQADRPA